MSIKQILTRILNTLKTIQDLTSQPILHASGEVTVNSAQMYEIARITVPANSRYLVLASTDLATGQTQQQACYITAMAGYPLEYYGGTSVKVPGTNGGGCATWLICITGDEAVTWAVRCYGYNTSSHKERGHIAGIPIGLGTISSSSLPSANGEAF